MDSKLLLAKRATGKEKKTTRKENKWLVHVKSVMKANKGMTFKDVLKKAKLSYRK
jgi:hypothetical protein